MTEERLALSELLEKAGDGDFLRTVAEAVLQLLMEADVKGLIGAGRYERSGKRLVPGLRQAVQRAQRWCPQSRVAAERHHRVRGVCRLRYRLTLRDLSEIMLLRGFTISHKSIRRWEAKLLPVMGEGLRKRRYGIGRISGQRWYADETYLKVHGRWRYLYRAIDRDRESHRHDAERDP